jgi:hypothetical protein
VTLPSRRAVHGSRWAKTLRALALVLVVSALPSCKVDVGESPEANPRLQSALDGCQPDHPWKAFAECMRGKGWVYATEGWRGFWYEESEGIARRYRFM